MISVHNTQDTSGAPGCEIVEKAELVEEWTQRLRARSHGSHMLDLDHDHKNSIFLAGSGRSGTTWVSDIINYKDEYRYVFEPFRPDKVEICKDFKRKQYLRPEDRREEFLRPARMILSGDFSSSWTDHLGDRIRSSRCLIKDIRANLILGWIHANFPQMPVIFLLRHPCAVAYSKTQLSWKSRLTDFLSQSDLVDDFLEPFAEVMRSASSDFERHIFTWCVENYVPLMQFGHREIHLTFYENMCMDPNEEVWRLFNFLGGNFDSSVLEKMDKPSLLSRPSSANLSSEKLVAEWRQHVTDAQLERAIEILGLFGLDRIYSEDVLPNTRGALAFMGTSSAKTSPEPERKSS